MTDIPPPSFALPPHLSFLKVLQSPNDFEVISSSLSLFNERETKPTSSTTSSSVIDAKSSSLSTNESVPSSWDDSDDESEREKIHDESDTASHNVPSDDSLNRNSLPQFIVNTNLIWREETHWHSQKSLSHSHSHSQSQGTSSSSSSSLSMGSFLDHLDISPHPQDSKSRNNDKGHSKTMLSDITSIFLKKFLTHHWIPYTKKMKSQSSSFSSDSMEFNDKALKWISENDFYIKILRPENLSPSQVKSYLDRMNQIHRAKKKYREQPSQRVALSNVVKTQSLQSVKHKITRRESAAPFSVIDGVTSKATAKLNSEFEENKSKRPGPNAESKLNVINEYSISVTATETVGEKPTEEIKNHHAKSSKKSKNHAPRMKSADITKEKIKKDKEKDIINEAPMVIQKIISSLENESLSIRIARLDEHLNKYDDGTAVAINGYLQLLSWQCDLIKEIQKTKGQWEWDSVAQLLHFCFDLFRRFHCHLSAANLRILMTRMVFIGMDREAEIMKKWFIDNVISEMKLQKEKDRALKELDLSHASLSNLISQQMRIVLPTTSIRFQLLHSSPYQLRHVDGRPDRRVPYFPDAWQVAVLNCIDGEPPNPPQSALIVCPTSAGKTMVSQYAMKKAASMRSASNSKLKKPYVVVYVCPTQALCNQTAAELSSTESLGHVEIFTREQKPNTMNFDILVTVPHSLEILFTSPSTQEWVNGLFYVVFDEVHLINNVEDGPTWERLLLMCPCPFIACSATLGEPRKLHNWMQSFSKGKVQFIGEAKGDNSEESKGFKIHRWAHLDTSIFHQNQIHSINPLSLISDQQIQSLHYQPDDTQLRRDFASSLELSSADCLQLYIAIESTLKSHIFNLDSTDFKGDESNRSNSEHIKDATNVKSIISLILSDLQTHLSPEVFFSSFASITRTIIDQWKDLLLEFLRDIITRRWNSSEDHNQEQDQEPLGKENIALYLLKISKQIIASLGPSEKSLSLMAPETHRTAIGSVTSSERHHRDGRQLSDGLLDLILLLKQRDWLPCLMFHLDQRGIEAICDIILKGLERREEEFLSTHDPKRYHKKKHRIDTLNETMRIREQFDQEIAAYREQMKDFRPDSDECKLLYDSIEKAENRKSQLGNDDWDLPLPEFCLGTNVLKQIDNEDYYLDRLESYVDSPWFSFLKRGFSYHHAALAPAQKNYVEALFRAGRLKLLVATGTLAMGINAPARSVVLWKDSSYINPVIFHQMRGRAGRRGYDNQGHVILAGFSLSRIQQFMTAPLPSLGGGLILKTTSILVYIQTLWQTQWDNDTHRQEVQQRVLKLFTHSMKGYSPSLLFNQFICSYHFLRSIRLLTPNGEPYCWAGIAHHLSYLGSPALLLSFLFTSGFVFSYCFKGESDVTEKKTKGNIIASGALNAVKLLCYLISPIPLVSDDQRTLPLISTKLQGVVNLYNHLVIKNFPLSIFASHLSFVPLFRFKNELLSSYALDFFRHGDYDSIVDNGIRDSQLYVVLQEFHFVLKKCAVVTELLFNKIMFNDDKTQTGINGKQKVYKYLADVFQLCSDTFGRHFSNIKRTKRPI